jgi:sulfonate transport system substrate-binding protein
MNRPPDRQSPLPTRRRLIGLLAISGIVALATACGGASNGAADSSGGQVTIRVGDQSRATDLPLRLAGQLDNLPYKVEINQFNSGPLVNQAIQAGAVDIGFMGDTPAMFAQASNLPVTVVGVSRYDGPGTTLVARPGSGIHSLADLKGKKIASSKNTALHGLLLLALAKAGLSQNDITLVDVPLQTLGNTLESGTVDAATLNEEPRLRYVKTHPDAVQLTNTHEVGAGYGFRIATKKALADPAKRAALKDFVGRLVKTNAWIKAHPAEYIDAYYVKERKQDPEIGRAVFAAQEATTRWVPISDEVRQAQQKQADLFLANGLFPKPVDVAPQFDPAVTKEFNEAVAAAGAT